MVTVYYTINTVWNEIKYVLYSFLQTLDTRFRINKCKILLNTIILLNQIKAYLYFHWKLMLSFRHYKSWCFNRLVRAKRMKFDFCKWSWCLYKVLVPQLGPTLCDSMDCNPPDSSVHAIFLARILEWIGIPSSRGSPQSRDWTQVSCTAGRCFTIWVTRGACCLYKRPEAIAWTHVDKPNRSKSNVHISTLKTLNRKCLFSILIFFYLSRQNNL